MYHLTAAAAAYTITRVSEHNIRKPKHTSSYIHSFVSYKDLKHSSKKKLNTQISLNAESSNAYLFWKAFSLFHCHFLWPDMKLDDSIS